MNWSGTRVLVTGAGGFIGSHLAEQLVEAGATVRAFTHYNALGNRGWLDHSPLSSDMEIVAGDIADRDSVRRAMHQATHVFHLAALISIPYSYEAPASFVQTNITGTLNVLQAARELGTERIIHTSSSEVYGTALYVPINEEHPLQGQSPYAATKIGADKIVESFYRSFEVPVVTVRPFNTFGPRQSTRAVIPTIITQCLVGQAVRLGNLTPTRDMNYVSNTVDGFLRAATVPEALGQTINLGSGREVSIRDLARMIINLINPDLEIENEAQRYRPEQSEVNRLLADSSLARALLEWEPLVTLEDGLQRTIEWMTRNTEKYRPDVYRV
jgi:dTDP-glucose 4,6-dehydratase